MTLYPTKSTFHVAVAGATMVAVGIAARAPSVVAFGAGMVLVLAAGRAIAFVLVTRLRAAGFDLRWVSSRRLVETGVGGEVELEVEIRNWGASSVRATNVRAIASSMLETVVEPRTLELPSATSTRVRLRVRGKRVGRWGIHGLALEVRGAPARSDGSFEVPLVFQSPFGIELLPRPLMSLVESPRGGRARRMNDAARPSRLAGEGDDFRELRDHVPGDPFKRIAWKASARRGELVVRETDRSERDVVWVILDASVELWAGELGHAPLDFTVEQVAGLVGRHLSRGDQVGLVIAASRVKTWLPPDTGSHHVTKITSALLGASVMVDEDRCELDDRGIATRVLEHAQATDPSLGAWLVRGDLESLARHADSLRRAAPFGPALPYATTPHGAVLRRYLAAFGIETPPREDGERERTDATIAGALEKIASQRDRPSMVYVYSPTPARKDVLARAIRRMRVRRVPVHWLLPPIEDSVGVDRSDSSGKPRVVLVREAIEDAVRVRARVERLRGADALRRIGAKVSPRFLSYANARRGTVRA